MALTVQLEKVRARLRRFGVAPERLDRYEKAARTCWHEAYASLKAQNYDPEIGANMSTDALNEFRDAHEALWQEPRLGSHVPPPGRSSCWRCCRASQSHRIANGLFYSGTSV